MWQRWLSAIMNRMSIFGILLVGTLVNIKTGLPILIGFVVMFFKKARLPKAYEVIAFLLILKLFWMLSTYFLIGTRTGNLYLPQLVAQDIILLLMLFISLRRVSVVRILTPIIFLFAIDFIYNISIILFGMDPIGRTVGLRVDDILPRAGGVFNHPFASINISAAAFFIGMFLKSKKIMFFALCALMLNGSMRGPLTGVLILYSAFLLYSHLNKRVIIIMLLSFVAAVFLVTYISANNAEYISGNYLRIISWGNALSHIVENPILGTHIFPEGEHGWVGDVHYSTRNSESQFLQNALDFGIIVAMINPLIFYILMHLNIKRFYSVDKSWERGSATLMIMTVFSDYFYGSFYGTILTQFVFSVIVISYTKSRRVQFFNNPKRL